MKTVSEVSELAGVSVRTLRYYDKIGLLSPTHRTASGYRLYDDSDLARLQQILLYRELKFSLKDIQRILGSPDFDQSRALCQQIELLELKRERLAGIIKLAKTMLEGRRTMDFEAFETTTMDQRTREAKESWGSTPEWRDFEQRSAGRTPEQERALGGDLLSLFVPFGEMAASGEDPASSRAQSQARLIQDFISDHYYACSNEVFAQLGRAYGRGGDFTRNINRVAGAGAAEFAARAIEKYVG